MPGSQPVATSPQPLVDVAVGDRVIVGGLGLEAVVTSVHDGVADLDVRGKRMRSSVRDLRFVSGAQASAAPAKVHVHVELQPRDGGTTRALGSSASMLMPTRSFCVS